MTGERAMSRRTAIAIALGLAALVGIVYAPVRHFDFVQLDDPAYVIENPHVLQGLTSEGLAWALTTGHAANWHPVTWLSHMLDVQLFGLAPGPHHMASLSLHLANTLLLFGLLARMSGAPWRSAFVAALFGVHPLHVESVAWVAERKDVLSTLFWILTTWAYVAYVRSTPSTDSTSPAPSRSAAKKTATPPPAASQARRGSLYALTLALYALGLMAKPMLVTLPFALLLLDVWPLGRLGPLGRTRARTLVREKLPLFCMAAASSAVTVLVQQKGGAVTTLESNPFSLRLQNALVSAAAYLRDAVWPARLTVIYPYPDAIPAWQTAGACVVLGGLSFMAYRLARRHPYLPVGWLWYLGTLVPVLGLVRVGLQARADRYTYVPLIGIFIAIAWGGAALAARARMPRQVAPIAAAVAIVACALAARTQVGYWQDNVSLFTRATVLTLHVDEYDAHMSLGATLAGQGRMDEALRHFTEAMRLRPDSGEARRAAEEVRRRGGFEQVPR
jgi:hypothetical protein